jgi:hypothetical protein
MLYSVCWLVTFTKNRMKVYNFHFCNSCSSKKTETVCKHSGICLVGASLQKIRDGRPARVSDSYAVLQRDNFSGADQSQLVNSTL